MNYACSYSPAAEIQHYLYNVAIKYDVMKYIQLNTRVTGAWWNEVCVYNSIKELTINILITILG